MEIILVILSFIIAFAMVHLAVPPIKRVAYSKNLFESNEERKVHIGTVPHLGGIAIFIGFIFSTIIVTGAMSFESLKYIIASVIAMFFIGLKDDMLNISMHKKLIVQLAAALLIITGGGIRFNNLQGIFLTHELGLISSTVVTLIVIVVIINAFNLVDGIDGLASGLAIVAGVFFGSWFLLSGNYQFAIMSFALVGSLAGFFVFNVYGKKYKMLMGDTGSLIIGLIVAVLIIKFNVMHSAGIRPMGFNAAPAISFAVIIVPLIDTLRIMTIRLIQGKSPFSPDRNHIHHRLLDLYPIHLKVTLLIVISNVLLIAAAWFFDRLSINVNFLVLILFLFGVLLSQLPSALLRSGRSGTKSNLRVIKKAT